MFLECVLIVPYMTTHVPSLCTYCPIHDNTCSNCAYLLSQIWQNMFQECVLTVPYMKICVPLVFTYCPLYENTCPLRKDENLEIDIKRMANKKSSLRAESEWDQAWETDKDDFSSHGAEKWKAKPRWRCADLTKKIFLHFLTTINISSTF